MASPRAASPTRRRGRRCWPCPPSRWTGRGVGRAAELPAPWAVSSYALDERGGAEAAAAAHRHEPDLLVGALELVQQRGDQPRAGRAERVAQGHRAAVDVHAVHVRVELATP